MLNIVSEIPKKLYRTNGYDIGPVVVPRGSFRGGVLLLLMLNNFYFTVNLLREWKSRNMYQFTYF